MKVRRCDNRVVTLMAPKTGMTGIGCGRRASQWKGCYKVGYFGVTRERAQEGWKTISCLYGCVSVLQVTLAYDEHISIYVAEGNIT